MSEHEPPQGEPASLRYIQLDLEKLSVTLRGDGENAPALSFSVHPFLAKLMLGPDLAEAAFDQTAPQQQSDRLIELSRPEAASVDAPAPPNAKEKTPSVSLTGRLKSQPIEGRPTKAGLPQAWAKLAVHEEGKEHAQMYSASFSRGAREIVLKLPKDAQITAEGYIREASEPGKMPAFNAFAVHRYPGKPEKGAG
jgi:hypothetical protein